MLFINYLRDQLGHSMSQIAQNGTGTLDGTYRAISHASIGGFSQFKRILDVHFPGPGIQSNSDNPFPLALTDVAAASAGRKDNLFVFVRMLDGRILFNQAAPGRAFVGWQEVPGGARTDEALAAGMQKDTLFVFAKQQDGRIIFNQAAPGGAFVGWQEMAGGVVTNVALASAGRQNGSGANCEMVGMDGDNGLRMRALDLFKGRHFVGKLLCFVSAGISHTN